MKPIEIAYDNKRSSICFRTPEAYASGVLEHIEDMFSRHNIFKNDVQP